MQQSACVLFGICLAVAGGQRICHISLYACYLTDSGYCCTAGKQLPAP
jgi:hypothetical protein